LTASYFLVYDSLWVWLIRLLTLNINQKVQLYCFLDLSPLRLGLITSCSQVAEPILADGGQIGVQRLNLGDDNLFF
jgi:hypothetical protein